MTLGNELNDNKGSNYVFYTKQSKKDSIDKYMHNIVSR